MVEAGVVCFGLVVAGIAFVVWLLVRGGGSRPDLEQEVRDLRRRVVALERYLSESTEEPASRPAAPPVQPPAPQPAEWIRRTPAPAAPPPPIPARPPAPLKPAVPRAVAAARATVAASRQSAPEPPRVSETPVAPRAAKPAVSIEAFLGGRVMLIVGVVVGLLGIAFFLKHMIDEGLIGPGTRVAMGALAGAALVVGGDVMRRRGFDVFGQALMGFGLGALYLSNYFACSIYDLIGPAAAFALTAAITAAGAALAIWRNAPVLAYLGFLGGYLAPWLLSTRTGDLARLTIWLAVLDAGLLVVLLRRAWQGLDLLALVATTVYVGVWFDRHAEGADLGVACACLAVLVVLATALGLLRPIVRRERPAAHSLLGVATAGTLTVLAAHALLFPLHRWGLGAGVAGIGALYFVASQLIAKRVEGARRESESLLGLAAAFAAIAITMTASGTAVSPALSAAGLAIVFAGTRTRHGVLTACGLATISLACGDLLLFRMEMFDHVATPFLNERFFVFACPAVAFLAAGRLMSKAEGVASETATLVGGAGLLVLPLVLAGDLYNGFALRGDLEREMRFVVPAAALAVYGFAAARLFGRGSRLGRTLAFTPVAFALVFGVTLLLSGHVRPFTLLVNPTFLAGLIVVAALRFAPREEEPAAWRSLGAFAWMFLLALVTAELYAWGETRSLRRFDARDWIVIAWASFACLFSVAELIRRRRGLSWIGTGSVPADRALAVLALGGSLLLHLATYLVGSSHRGWIYGSLLGSSLRPFANIHFTAGLAITAAAHVVGRPPFDAARRVFRMSGLGYLLLVLTIEIYGGAHERWPGLDTLAWMTVLWAVFAVGVAWRGAARKAPPLRWLGIDDERIEAALAFVPLAGAAVLGSAAMARGHAAAFTPVFNFPFVAELLVAGAMLAVGQRNGVAGRNVCHFGAVLWGLLLVTSEIVAWGHTCDVGTGTREEAEFRAVVWISVAWAVYAAALVVAGFARKVAGLRWMGLGVFALTLGKVFLVDLRELEAVYRIGSFLVLGAFLVAASFLYQRARRAEALPGDSGGTEE